MQKMSFYVVCITRVLVDLPDGQLIEGQEEVYKTKNVGTLNCLLEVPREYARRLVINQSINLTPSKLID